MNTASASMLGREFAVERKDLAQLTPFVRNSRTHTQEQVEQIARSISEWGFTNPILIDEWNTILAGHGRYAAAKFLGLTDVPVIVANGWTDEQKRAYVIADNKLAMNAGWDADLLALELGDLRESNYAIDLTGFTAEEFAAIFAKLAEPTPPEDFKELDENIKTEHCCPKCGYEWSGNAMPPTDD